MGVNQTRRSMKFLFNFVFFGVLFYVIYLFFPDAFRVLVSWADSAYQLIRDLGLLVYRKVQELRQTSPSTPSAALWQLGSLIL